MTFLETAEYIEQAHLFRTLAERLGEQIPLQDLLSALRHELLASTRLPMAVDFLLTELKHSGMMSPAMKRLPHYFAHYQSYLVEEAEREEGQFDMRTERIARIVGVQSRRAPAQSREGRLTDKVRGTLC